MSLKFALHALVIGYALSLMGCASTPAPLPPELQYREPAPEAQAGTIIGFQVETTWWKDNKTAFLFAIDDKRVLAGRDGWSRPLRLGAGNHRITAAIQQGLWFGYADMNLDVAQGRAYRVRFFPCGDSSHEKYYCDLWFEDLSTSKPVTDQVVTAEVVLNADGMNFGRPVPIFLPKK